jgi:hypothetical protein
MLPFNVGVAIRNLIWIPYCPCMTPSMLWWSNHNMTRVSESFWWEPQSEHFWYMHCMCETVAHWCISCLGTYVVLAVQTQCQMNRAHIVWFGTICVLCLGRCSYIWVCPVCTFCVITHCQSPARLFHANGADDTSAISPLWSEGCCASYAMPHSMQVCLCSGSTRLTVIPRLYVAMMPIISDTSCLRAFAQWTKLLIYLSRVQYICKCYLIGFWKLWPYFLVRPGLTGTVEPEIPCTFFRSHVSPYAPDSLCTPKGDIFFVNVNGNDEKTTILGSAVWSALSVLIWQGSLS